jgi:hypothetical protein
VLIDEGSTHAANFTCANFTHANFTRTITLVMPSTVLAFVVSASKVTADAGFFSARVEVVDQARPRASGQEQLRALCGGTRRMPTPLLVVLSSARRLGHGRNMPLGFAVS